MVFGQNSQVPRTVYRTPPVAAIVFLLLIGSLCTAFDLFLQTDHARRLATIDRQSATASLWFMSSAGIVVLYAIVLSVFPLGVIRGWMRASRWRFILLFLPVAIVVTVNALLVLK